MTTVRITAEQARDNADKQRKSTGHRSAANANREEKRQAAEQLPSWMNGDRSVLPMRPPGKGAG